MTDVIDQPTIGLDGARRAIDAALAKAAEIGVAVVIIVVDPAGEPVALARMDGSPVISRGVAADKAWTAICFGQSSGWWASAIASEPVLASLGANNRLMPVPGGEPIVVGGSLVGGVGVSGATAEQDEAIAKAGTAVVAS